MSRTLRIPAMQANFPIIQAGSAVVLFVYGAATIGGFAQEQSVRSMLVLAALLGIAAAGQTLCVLIGAIDLSVPGLVVLGATAISELCGSHGWNLMPAIAVVALGSLAVGAAVGWICHRLQMTPIIVTLGVSALVLGAVQVWTHNQLTGTVPSTLSNVVAPNSTTLGLPIPPVVFIWAGLAIVLALVLHRTRVGRHLYATGANPKAAEFALVGTRRVWTWVFAVSALLSGLVGVLLAGFAGADPTLGDPYLFQGLTAVIVGGTAFGGARGDYSHTVVGALILTELTTILVGRGLGVADQQIIFGVLILLVVATYGRGARLRDRV